MDVNDHVTAVAVRPAIAGALGMNLRPVDRPRGQRDGSAPALSGGQRRRARSASPLRRRDSGRMSGGKLDRKLVLRIVQAVTLAVSARHRSSDVRQLMTL
ncbi:MAG: hypothetical protein LJE69_03960 [Thiohalocapsa sp.]|uniref:hypothetical protein n=1 Tax=Thiohalocapsa sp. TaxID=2497641 RepID=UPI0025E0600C|nr:hypothetical protein [Thiohalocapsa sp.]MCG6940389.1 hypothetical protein [Thiohalocapsa sp.]